MSLRRSVIASYISQTYVTLIGILMMPVYLRFLGAEAFGLVGFFGMLQAWFQLLDFGLAPTMSRETARYVGGATDAVTLRRLLRVLEALFVVVAIIGGVALGLSAAWVTSSWLQVDRLPAEEVRRAIQLMAAIVGLRWMSGLYRGALGGFEQQVWLGRLNITTATARFVAIVPIFIFVGATPVLFFVYQLLIAIAETIALVVRTYALLPALPVGSRTGFHLKPLRSVLSFSMTIAFTGAVWVAVTQTDKLLLSRLLPLTDYAYFTLAVLLAGGVSLVSSPLSSALLPRLSRLHAQDQHAELVALYRQTTQGMAVVATPVAVVFACAAEPLLYAWTGDKQIAERAAPILQLYALGNGILAMSAFPYYLQFAKGDVRLHLIGNVLFAVVLVPSIWMATLSHGVMGAAWAWLAANITFALLWIPLVHRRFAPGLHTRWMLQDVAAIAVAAAVTTLLLTRWTPWPSSRPATVGLLIVVLSLTLVVAALASSQVRNVIRVRMASTHLT
ncbi:MAG TPA: oligosaccharide flippase family protein [Burkholderiaceae bacterium]|nr:oligosaccharide flippase family protein [Burkholderiaceae bacterium]